MPWLLGDHGQRDQAQFSVIEGASAAAAPAVAMIPVSVMAVWVSPGSAIRQILGKSETTV